MEEIRFIAHSCISIKVGGKSLLCDPWFFGRAFDQSWCHIVEPDPEQFDLDSLAYIWISHEHPDHFSIPTLKYLAEYAKNDILVMFRRQADKNVAEFLEKLGFDVMELDEFERVYLEGIGHITPCHKKSDTALLIETEESTILNLNDCMLPQQKCRRLKRSVAGIDFLFCQFSLAGYSGNPEDSRALAGKRAWHEKKVQEYFNYFSPSWFVPFASFVTFCTPYNHYLNRWRLTVDDVAGLIPGQSLQIVFNNDVLWRDIPRVMDRNAINRRKWEQALNEEEFEPAERPAIDDGELLAHAREFGGIFRGWPRHSYPAAIRIRLRDKPLVLFLDFRSGQVSTADRFQGSVDAAVSSHSLVSLIKNPWGADTLNISGEAIVYKPLKWRWLLFCRHYCYKPVTRLSIGRYIPRIYALLKPMLN